MVLGSVLWLNTRDADAKKPYWPAFEKKYAKPRSGEPGDAVLAEEIAAARCNLCHAGAKKKFNAYGLAIREAKKAEGERKGKIERRGSLPIEREISKSRRLKRIARDMDAR